MSTNMNVGVKQAAELLGVSDKTIYRWIYSGRIPFCRVGTQYRFSRNELLQWAEADQSENADKAGSTPICLEQGLRSGGIFYRVGGADVRGVLTEMLSLIKLPSGVDVERILESVYQRERIASTALGEGFAFPHCRDLKLSGVSHPLIALGFLDQPVDFFAIDGQPVFAVFMLLSPSSSASIRAMARLAYAVRQPGFLQELKEIGARERIFSEAEAVDRQLERDHARA